MNVNPNQESALENYFDALLFADDGSVFDDAEEVSPLFSVKKAAPILQPVKQVESIAEIEVVEAVKEVAPQVVAPVVVDTPQVPPAVETVVNKVLQDTENENYLAIAKRMTSDQFLFIQPMTVVGLKLAVAMDSVADVISFEEAKVNRMGNGGTILGSMTYKNSEILVLDTASIIVPSNHPRRSAMLERKDYQHILVLDGGSLAIAVDALDEEVYLPTDNIHWNPPTSHYKWLAGTMKDYGYALVNTEKLVNYFM